MKFKEMQRQTEQQMVEMVEKVRYNIVKQLCSTETNTYGGTPYTMPLLLYKDASIHEAKRKNMKVSEDLNTIEDNHYCVGTDLSSNTCLLCGSSNGACECPMTADRMTECGSDRLNRTDTFRNLFEERKYSVEVSNFRSQCLLCTFNVPKAHNP